jgi:hypothetical protein
MIQGRVEVITLKLFSLLTSAIHECGTNKAGGLQWLGTINNLQKRGVSAAEIEWSGVLEFLRGLNDQKVSRDQVIDYLTQSGICDLTLKRGVTEHYSPTLRYRKFPRPEKMPPFVMVGGRRELQLLHYTEGSFGLSIWMHLEADEGLFGRHCYWSLSIPRGRSKLGAERGRRQFATVKEAMAYGGKILGRFQRKLTAEGFVGEKQSVGLFRRYALPGGKSYSEWLLCADRFPKKYKGGHFDLDNIVAHIRTTEWLDTHGAKFLLLEEIQSDWNQSLRASIREETAANEREGNQGELLLWDSEDGVPPMNPYLNHWLEAALRAMLLLAADKGLSGIAWLPGRFHAERYSDYGNEGLKIFYDELVPSAVMKLARSWGVVPGTVKFQTHTRSFFVGYRGREKNWFIRTRATGKIIEEGFKCLEEAESARLRMERVVHETVPFFPMTGNVRSDLNESGLPFLGAVGNRLTKIQKSPVQERK